MLRRVYQQLLDLLFPLRETQRLVRNATIEELRGHIALKEIATNDSSVVSLLSYRERLVQALITEAKYANNAKAQELLGMLLADWLNNYIKVYGKCMVIPIPLGAKRRADRGYNQTEEICRFALEYLENPNNAGLRPEILTRTRDTEPQTSLGRQSRMSNMQGAFAVPTTFFPIDPSRSYILFDDVLTTGATLAAAREALVDANAVRISLLTLAH